MTNGTDPTPGPQATTDPAPTDTQLTSAKVKDLEEQLTLLKAEYNLKNAQLTAALEQQTAVVQQQKSFLSELFPAVGETNKGLEGKIETDEEWGVAAGIVALQVMRRLQAQFVDQIKFGDQEEGGNAQQQAERRRRAFQEKKILIVDTLEHAQNDIPLWEVKEQYTLYQGLLQDAKRALNECKDECKAVLNLKVGEGVEEGVDEGVDEDTVPLALAASLVLPSLVSTMAGVAGYFRTDYSVKGRAVSLQPEALQAAVAHKLRQERAKVFFPDFYFFYDANSNEVGNGAPPDLEGKRPPKKLYETFMNLQNEEIEVKKCREKVDSLVKLLPDKIQKLQRHIPEAEADLEKLDKESQKVERETKKNSLDKLKKEVKKAPQTEAQTKDVIQKTNVLLTAFDNFNNSITSSADEKNPPKLAKAMLREKVHDMGITHILWLGTQYIGGDAIAARNLWSSGKTSYIGGTAISFVLADKGTGEVVAADTLMGLGALDYKYFKLVFKESKVRYIQVSE